MSEINFHTEDVLKGMSCGHMIYGTGIVTIPKKLHNVHSSMVSKMRLQRNC
jgi:hypothetical protein